jgi:hypothetical protein
MRKRKSNLKSRWQTEVAAGAKLFYLSGVINRFVAFALCGDYSNYLCPFQKTWVLWRFLILVAMRV